MRSSTYSSHDQGEAETVVVTNAWDVSLTASRAPGGGSGGGGGTFLVLFGIQAILHPVNELPNRK
jgi:hypothetical protein